MDGEVSTSKGWQALQIIFWTLLTALTVVGNGLVLACVALKKRRTSSTYKFYGSLALGDLLVGRLQPRNVRGENYFIKEIIKAIIDIVARAD